MEGTDLWLECDYNTLGDTVDVTATLLGGLELGSEHCLAVLTYSAKLTGPVTSCSSKPSEYSVLYALDMYLSTQVELGSSVFYLYCTVSCFQDYEEYSDDYYGTDEGEFDSYNDYDDYSAFGKRRRKRQAHVGGSDQDTFMKKVTDDNRPV